MNARDRLELLYESANEITLGIEKLELAIAGTSRESNARAYIVNSLNNSVDHCNPYDQSIQTLIDELEGNDPDLNDWGQEDMEINHE